MLPLQWESKVLGITGNLIDIRSGCVAVQRHFPLHLINLPTIHTKKKEKKKKKETASSSEMLCFQMVNHH